MRVILLVAVAASIFSSSTSTAFDTGAGAAAAKPYTNIWAVEVNGNKEEADALAAKHHLVNKGQVSALMKLELLPLAPDTVSYFRLGD